MGAVTAEIAPRQAEQAARERQAPFLPTGEVNRQAVVQDPHQPGAKLDQDKVDLTYLAEYFPRACEAVCRCAELGEQKYIRGGWRSVPDGVRRYTKALWRHLFRLGDDDPVPGVPPKLIHDAQVAWNALARLELLLGMPPAGFGDDFHAGGFGGGHR
jgi:hypothetical protein